MAAKRIYKKNFLSDVVLRVDFYPILELTTQPPVKFQEKISQDYPTYEEMREVVDNSIVNGWKFKNKEKNRLIVLTPKQLTVEFSNSYKHFEEFINECKKILDILIELYPVKITKRIGLRYINTITASGSDWSDWNNLINKELWNIPISLTNKKDVTRHMHSLEVKQDKYYLRFQFGFFNSEYPQPISKKEFVLDFDCSTPDFEMEISETISKAKEFHEVVHTWFEKSIGDGLRTEMGVD